uniref:Uncharacterized protein n=1 Tax=viral metagenome TaxID=1070528 RepID=A0A6C0HI43_9ZZZZ
MAVFVTTENQVILWRMLQQHPQFYNMEFSQKNELFRKTIEAIYFENEHVQLNYQQLIELNKKTIRGILDRVIQPMNKIVVESSEDRSVREFREREEVYQKMTKKPDLPDAKKMFEEPVVDDDVITNMEERLLQYQSQRSLDISNIEIQQNQHNQDKNQNQSMVEEMMKKIQELEQRVAALETNLN